jgi:hypothetical protein
MGGGIELCLINEEKIVIKREGGTKRETKVGLIY